MTDQDQAQTQPPASEVCEPLVNMLTQLLAQAKSGKLQGAAVMMVHGAGHMGPMMAPHDKWLLEYLGAARMLDLHITGMWMAQITANSQQAQQHAQQFRRGVTPVPADALNSLPRDFFNNRKA